MDSTEADWSAKFIYIFTAGPHTKFAKVLFSQAPVILSGGGGGRGGWCVAGCVCGRKGHAW